MPDAAVQKGPIDYRTTREMAETLDVTVPWLQHYTRDGVIPAIKIGRRYFYDEAAVREAMDELLS